MGKRFSSPIWSGWRPAAKRYLVNFRLKISPLVAITIFGSFPGNETSNWGLRLFVVGSSFQQSSEHAAYRFRGRRCETATTTTLNVSERSQPIVNGTFRISQMNKSTTQADPNVASISMTIPSVVREEMKGGSRREGRQPTHTSNTLARTQTADHPTMQYISVTSPPLRFRRLWTQLG